jgi:hypothetical protein
VACRRAFLREAGTHHPQIRSAPALEESGLDRMCVVARGPGRYAAIARASTPYERGEWSARVGCASAPLELRVSVADNGSRALYRSNREVSQLSYRGGEGDVEGLLTSWCKGEEPCVEVHLGVLREDTTTVAAFAGAARKFVDATDWVQAGCAPSSVGRDYTSQRGCFGVLQLHESAAHVIAAESDEFLDASAHSSAPPGHEAAIWAHSRSVKEYVWSELGYKGAPQESVLLCALVQDCPPREIQGGENELKAGKRPRTCQQRYWEPRYE